MRRAISCLLVTAATGLAVFEEMETGTRAQGMAGAFTALADDACAIHYNPAGLTQVDRIQVYTFYALLYGGVGENLHNATLNAAVPLGRPGTLGVSIQDVGFALEHERCLTLTHGFGLAKDLNFGYGLTAYNLAMSGLGQTFALGIELGLHARLYRRWTMGFFAHNLNQPQVGIQSRTCLPRLLNFGIAYSPALGITSSLDVSKEVGQKTRVAVGQEFQILEDVLVLRAGVQTEPVRLSFGLGTGTRTIHLDYALLTHSELPLTHNLGLSVRF